MKRSRTLVAFGGTGLLIGWLALSPRLNAQVVGGTIRGTVADPSGAVVPEVQVKIAK
jgi:hypothetical protein